MENEIAHILFGGFNRIIDSYNFGKKNQNYISEGIKSKEQIEKLRKEGEI